MKVGDLVSFFDRHGTGKVYGIVTHIDPEEIGDNNEVMVEWLDGEATNHSAGRLELISENRKKFE